MFASEIKAIVAYLRHMRRAGARQPGSIATYVATGLVDGLEQTFFEGVTRFPAGANDARAAVTACGRASYWDLPAPGGGHARRPESQRHAHSALAGVRAALDEAVRVHLRSDVPLGRVPERRARLERRSSAWRRSHVERVKTFTVYFADGPDYDERQHAHPIVEQFGADAVRTLHRARRHPRHAEAASCGTWTSRRWRWASSRSGT